MWSSETALLTAVRDRLRNDFQPSWRTLDIDIWHEESVPAIQGQKYIAIYPLGVNPGPTHNTSGGVVDMVFSVGVSVIMQAPKTPHDRTKDLYVGYTGTLNRYVWNVFAAIDFKYTEVINAANTLIQAEEGTAEQGFIEPLRMSSMDSGARQVSSSFFLGSGKEPRAGLVKRIVFSGARRIKNR